MEVDIACDRVKAIGQARFGTDLVSIVGSQDIRPLRKCERGGHRWIQLPLLSPEFQHLNVSPLPVLAPAQLVQPVAEVAQAPGQGQPVAIGLMLR